jgi:hypothetical protein
VDVVDDLGREDPAPPEDVLATWCFGHQITSFLSAGSSES